MQRSVLAAFAIFLVAACSRAPVDDGPSSRADDTAAAPPLPAADSRVTPTHLLPPPDALDDGVITARVRASLLVDPSLAGSDISVSTDHGIVNLTGTVPSREQAVVALAHAQAQDGVMRVDDHLSVELR